MGDQSGAIHIWDLKTDHNEQLVSNPNSSDIICKPTIQKILFSYKAE